MSSITAQRQLKQYERNMKIFVKQVEDQISLLINKYQAKIQRLQQQNKKLNNALLERQTSNPEDYYDYLNKYPINECKFPNFSPIKDRPSSNLNNSATYFMTPKQFPIIKPIFGETDNSYGGDLQRSRFECQKIKTKQKQQQLLQSLQCGKNNLDLNTTKMLCLFGKQKLLDKAQDNNNEQQQQTQERAKSENQSYALNTSLSSLCQSMNTSFHAQKSRSKHKKQRKEKQVARNKKLEEARLHQKKRKEQGLRNLLKSLRNNVNSVNQQTQIIRNTRLLSAGVASDSQNIGQKSVKLNKSKVMFNPVPVDITKRAERTNNNSVNRGSNNSQNPQSILKGSSKILTKSMIGNTTTISQQF